jgi:hypothetical protein
MKLKCYLVIQGKPAKFGPDREQRRDPGNLKLTKAKPSTDRDEIAIALDLEIPDSLFIKPTLEARITVPECTPHGGNITAEVADNIAEEIRRQTGFSVHISAEQEDE